MLNGGQSQLPEFHFGRHPGFGGNDPEKKKNVGDKDELALSQQFSQVKLTTGSLPQLPMQKRMSSMVFSAYLSMLCFRPS